MFRLSVQDLFNLINLPRDYPLKFLPDTIGETRLSTKVPPVVYQTWEATYLPRRLHSSVSKFRNMNPEFSFHLFTKEDRDAYMKENWSYSPISEIYERARFGQLRTDIFRYCLLFEKGGWYFDISKGAAAPLRNFIEPDSQEILTFENNDMPSSMVPNLNAKKILGAAAGKRIVQWGFGFSPKHPLLELHISRIVDRWPQHANQIFANPKEAILEYTGPIAFTSSVWYHIDNCQTTLNMQGIDFNGLGIFSLKGAGARYWKSRNYRLVRDEPLFD